MKTAMLGLVVLLVLVVTIPVIDSAFAYTEPIPDGDGEGGHEGKSCPVKNKTASITTNLIT